MKTVQLAHSILFVTFAMRGTLPPLLAGYFTLYIFFYIVFFVVKRYIYKMHFISLYLMIFKQVFFFLQMVLLIRTSPSTSSLFFRRKIMARYMQNCGIPVLLQRVKGICYLS